MMLIKAEINGMDITEDFGYYISSRQIGAALPKTNLVEVPGANGFTDLTDVLGPVRYGPRQITLQLLDIADNYLEKYSALQRAYNGQKVQVSFADDPDYYYTGRATVDYQYRERKAARVALVATCQPYKYRWEETVITETLTTSFKSIQVNNGGMPVLPSFEVNKETTVSWGNSQYVMNAGTHYIPGIILPSGASTLKAKSNGGTIKIKFREASL